MSEGRNKLVFFDISNKKTDELWDVPHTTIGSWTMFTGDDQTILFNGSDLSLPQDQQTWDLFKINSDGTGIKNLTNTSDRDESSMHFAD